jgi:enoyl-CoA hydratase/carnithine racemase
MTYVLREDRDGAAILTLNRPDKLNAVHTPLFSALSAHVDALERTPDSVGLVVLRGAGKAFCAGNDLAAIAAGDTPPKPTFQSEIIERLANLPQPVMVVVHGACFTGGLELALAGDLIVATPSARFGDTHAKFALTPIWGMSQRLPRRIGRARASQMMFSCRAIAGEEAHAWGLADYLFQDATLEADLNQLIKAITSLSWFSHRANKALLRETDGLTLRAGLAHEFYRSAGRGPDMEERIAAFTQRAR